MAALAMQPHDSLLPRSPGGTGPGAALSLLAHAGLLAALAYGVAWRAPPPDVVSAELWAAVPQVAAPRAVEPEPTPTLVPRAVEKAAPAPAPARPDAQIAVEKAKKEQAAKAALAERDKTERRQRQKEAAEEAAEEARIAQQREENLKRMQGQIASSPGGRGNAAADAAPSATYAGRLVRAIKPNIVLTDEIAGNPAAEVEVNTAPSGSIIGWRLLKPSGSKEWDDAVLRAIDRTETLPRDTDGRVPSRLVISFRPRD